MAGTFQAVSAACPQAYLRMPVPSVWAHGDGLNCGEIGTSLIGWRMSRCTMPVSRQSRDKLLVYRKLAVRWPRPTCPGEIARNDQPSNDVGWIVGHRIAVSHPGFRATCRAAGDRLDPLRQ